MPTILLTDDDEHLRRGLSEYFENAGFTVYQARTGKEAVTTARRWRPNAILMDMQLPDQTGLETVEAIKKDPATCGIPILVFTAHHNDGHLAESREHGADGYLVKGGPWEEVLGYIQLLIQAGPTNKAGTQAPEEISAGPVRVNLEQRKVAVSGKPTLPLTPKEFDLLVLLLKKNSAVLPWETIARTIWNEPAKYGKDSKTIELHAQRLRKKLGPEAGNLLITHRGIGLQFVKTPLS